MKIGLGTAQFGLDYGLANKNGVVPQVEVKRIADLFKERGLSYVDTAPQYGKSEKVIGDYFPSECKVTTKISSLRDVEIENRLEFMETVFEKTLTDLRKPFVYGLLLHDAADLLSPDAARIYDRLQHFKGEGWVQKIGVSVYEGSEIEHILQNFNIDLIQLPYNVFDQRLKKILKELKSAGVEIHARSPFLQGLVLMDPAVIPSYFSSSKKLFERFSSYLKENNLSAIHAALGYLNSINEIDVIICGVDNYLQFEEILTHSNKRLSVEAFDDFSISDLNIIDPRLWSKVK